MAKNAGFFFLSLLLFNSPVYAALDVPFYQDFIQWVLSQQAAFHRELVSLVRAISKEGNPTLLWGLITTSFFYGVFHAAGPGHGKAVISAYMLASKAPLRRGIMLSFLCAGAQGVMAVLVILVLSQVFSLAGRAMQISQFFEVASFAAVGVIGVWMLTRLLRGKSTCGHDHSKDHLHGHHHEHGSQCNHHDHSHSHHDDCCSHNHGSHEHKHDDHEHQHDKKQDCSSHKHDHSHTHHNHEHDKKHDCSAHEHDHSHSHHNHEHDKKHDCSAHKHDHSHTHHDGGCSHKHGSHDHQQDEHKHHHTEHSDEETKTARRSLWAMILAVGIRPCTGAILVLLFSLSADIFQWGLVATFAMAFGTAITVATLASLSVFVRETGFAFSHKHHVWRNRVSRGFGFIAAIALIVVSSSMITSYISNMGRAF